MFDEMFPILSTADLSRALGFYRDLLDATMTYQFPAGGAPGYVGLALGGSHLGIGQRTEPGDTAANDQITLWVYATDCDAAVQRLREADVPIVEEPTDQPWGERMATVLDPDGNRVIIASRAPTAT